MESAHCPYSAHRDLSFELSNVFEGLREVSSWDAFTLFKIGEWDRGKHAILIFLYLYHGVQCTVALNFCTMVKCYNAIISEVDCAITGNLTFLTHSAPDGMGWQSLQPPDAIGL